MHRGPPCHVRFLAPRSDRATTLPDDQRPTRVFALRFVLRAHASIRAYVPPAVRTIARGSSVCSRSGEERKMRERERELPLLYRSTWTYFIDVSWVEEVRYERIRRFLEIFFLFKSIKFIGYLEADGGRGGGRFGEFLKNEITRE